MKKILLLIATTTFTYSMNAVAGFDDIKKPVTKKPEVTKVESEQEAKDVTHPNLPLPKTNKVAKPTPIIKSAEAAKPLPTVAEPKAIEKPTPKPTAVLKPKPVVKKVVAKQTPKPAPIQEVKPQPAPAPEAEQAPQKPMFEQAKDNVKEASHEGLKSIGGFLSKLKHDIKNNGSTEAICSSTQKAMNQC